MFLANFLYIRTARRTTAQVQTHTTLLCAAYGVIQNVINQQFELSAIHKNNLRRQNLSMPFDASPSVFVCINLLLISFRAVNNLKRTVPTGMSSILAISLIDKSSK